MQKINKILFPRMIESPVRLSDVTRRRHCTLSVVNCNFSLLRKSRRATYWNAMILKQAITKQLLATKYYIYMLHIRIDTSCKCVIFSKQFVNEIYFAQSRLEKLSLEGAQHCEVRHRCLENLRKNKIIII